MNVRRGPSTDSAVVAQLEPKEPARVLVPVDGWHPLVRNASAKDTIGWVHENVLHAEQLTPDEKAEIAAAQRQIFAENLEDTYLDQGMDIRVSVHGRHNTTLRLEWVLFGRVWAHNFSEGEHWQTIRDLGFKRVEMRDGYDFSWRWTL